jgi:hypothetical protein
VLAGCAPKVRIVALDAPELELRIAAATLQDHTPAGGRLGGAATSGAAQVLASGGVEVHPADRDAVERLAEQFLRDPFAIAWVTGDGPGVEWVAAHGRARWGDRW